MEMFHRIVMYSNYELLLTQPNSTCLYDSMLVPWDSIETTYNNTTGTTNVNRILCIIFLKNTRKEKYEAGST